MNFNTENNSEITSMAEKNQDNGWNEWSRHVLAELERLNTNFEVLNTRSIETQKEIGDISTTMNIIRDQVSGKDGLIDKTADHEIRIRTLDEDRIKVSTKLNWKIGGLVVMIVSVLELLSTFFIKKGG
jgi:hypothetical protein